MSHPPADVVWLTGMSGSGKTTIARALLDRLESQGVRCAIIDGDVLREGLSSDLGFSREDRAENIRRAGEVAKLFSDAGIVAIVALISPLRAERARVRERIGAPFVEVFVDAPLAVCEQRDPKGLYRRARSGEIAEFTGISSPYEPPEDPDLTLSTARLDVHQGVEAILELLGSRMQLAERR